MTDRDHFAAAALTGLLYPDVDDEFAMPYIVGRAYLWADAMLRERCRAGADCPLPDNAPNHDAAPEATANAESVAPQPTAGDRAGNPPSHSGTGDTQEPVAWGVAHPNDEVAVIAFKRQDAEARATASDRIVPLYRHPPVTEPMPQEKQAEVSDRSKPITGPDPDSRVWETHTPATHATQGECSKPREGTEPVAWAVTMGDGSVYEAFAAHQRDEAVELARRCLFGADGPLPLAPLYRHPPCQDLSQKNLTLTDAEAETLRELRDEAAQYADEIGLCASEVRVRQRIIDGLLERLGGAT